MANFHAIKIEECFKELGTSLEGLTQKEAEKRLQKNGENKLEEEKAKGKLEILFEQFKSPLIYILLIAGVISFLLGEHVDAGVILGAVFINTIIGFFQENKANEALTKLKKMVEHKALVLRDGEEHEIDSKFLTVGDIVVLQSGNRTPADVRIIDADNLKINEANLTGESVPSSKSTKEVSKGTAMADRENMAYASTVISSGSGLGVVTAVGNHTEIGKIAQLVKSTEEEKTPLQIRLAKLSKFIGIVVTIICLLVVLIGVLQGREFLEMFIVGVAIAVASIPEGLVVAVTVILVLGMQRILKKKALTRRLVAAETLGSTTVICTDKTGTLTEGKMHVAHIVIGEKEFEVEDTGSRQQGTEAKNVSLALQIGMLCNDAVVENFESELGKLKIIGAPTESALLSAGIHSGLNRKEILKREPRIAKLPFDSSIKYMITLHERQERGYVLYEKGAPERLLEKSASFLHEGENRKLTDAEKKKMIKTYENLTNKGLRVIGVAIRNISQKEFDEKIKSRKEKKGTVIVDNVNWKLIDNNLTFVGFIAIKDPLRPEAKETIKTCRTAGIRPVIITGDHKLTAKAIGEEVGLKVKEENIITGDVLDEIDDKKLKKLVKKVKIYARVSPHHKLRIIKALQANNEVVAMTGDGINDSPAIKAADIGISLGTGTDIAKETADIVLLDDNFSTIVSAVRQGRVIFFNIRKVVTYLVSDSFSEVILIVGSIILGMPLAILPVQILWINIVNDGLPHFSLAFEKGDKDIMRKKPIKREEPIVNSEMKTIIFAAGIIRDLFYFGIFYFLFRNDFSIEYIRTFIFAAIGVDSLIYIFSLRSLNRPIWKINLFSNPYLLGAVSISFSLLLISIYLPFFQKALSTIPLHSKTWFVIFGISLINIIMIETVKHHFIIKEKKAKV